MDNFEMIKFFVLLFIIGTVMVCSFLIGRMTGTHKERMFILSVLRTMRVEGLIKIQILDELERGWHK